MMSDTTHMEYEPENHFQLSNPEVIKSSDLVKSRDLELIEL